MNVTCIYVNWCIFINRIHSAHSLSVFYEITQSHLQNHVIALHPSVSYPQGQSYVQMPWKHYVTRREYSNAFQRSQQNASLGLVLARASSRIPRVWTRAA